MMQQLDGVCRSKAMVFASTEGLCNNLMGCVRPVPWFSCALVKLFGRMQQLDGVWQSNAMVFVSADVTV